MEIDLFMGTPASEDGRVVETQLPTAEEIATGPLPSDSGDPLGSLPLPIGNVFDLLGEANTERSRRVGPPAAGVLASARGLAALYASLRHEINGVLRLLSDETIAQMSQIQVSGIELGSGRLARLPRSERRRLVRVHGAAVVAARRVGREGGAAGGVGEAGVGGRLTLTG